MYVENSKVRITLRQWSNCGGTRGNGVPLPFLAGNAVPLAYTIAVGGRGGTPPSPASTPLSAEV